MEIKWNKMTIRLLPARYLDGTSTGGWKRSGIDYAHCKTIFCRNRADSEFPCYSPLHCTICLKPYSICLYSLVEVPPRFPMGNKGILTFPNIVWVLYFFDYYFCFWVVNEELPFQVSKVCIVSLWKWKPGCSRLFMLCTWAIWGEQKASHT